MIGFSDFLLNFGTFGFLNDNGGATDREKTMFKFEVFVKNWKRIMWNHTSSCEKIKYLLEVALGAFQIPALKRTL